METGALAGERPGLGVGVQAAAGLALSRGSDRVTYVNPVVAENCPDPHVLHDHDTYYMVSTSHVLPAFPIRESTDLAQWRNIGASVFTRANKPAWAVDHVWAPELHRVAGRYVAYFTARSKFTGRLCIGAAPASTPLGPYEESGQPLISADVTVLDATFFPDDDSRQYL